MRWRYSLVLPCGWSVESGHGLRQLRHPANGNNGFLPVDEAFALSIESYGRRATTQLNLENSARYYSVSSTA